MSSVSTYALILYEAYIIVETMVEYAIQMGNSASIVRVLCVYCA